MHSCSRHALVSDDAVQQQVAPLMTEKFDSSQYPNSNSPPTSNKKRFPYYITMADHHFENSSRRHIIVSGGSHYFQ